MNLLETLLSANNGGVVSELAKTFGVGESDARNAVRQMALAVTRGLRRRPLRGQRLAVDREILLCS
tara:strand:+ start:62 stop:259 length:198 start_codon:yes stop_codon:yes gene_type:complete